MLRFKILASAVPLIVVAVFARGGLLPGPRPCITIADTSVQITSLAWQAQLHVSFTSDPAAATVRVQISDSADAADFAVVDDVVVPRPVPARPPQRRGLWPFPPVAQCPRP